MMNDMNVEKFDVYNFNYSDSDDATIESIVGNSIDIEVGERYITSINLNPNVDNFEEIIRNYIYNRGYTSATLGIDYRLLTDGVIDILSTAYNNHAIRGVRILPAGKRLDKELYDKFNNSSFTGMLLVADAISNDINLDESEIDLRVENGLVRIEITEYMDRKRIIHNNDNIHIIRELSEDELSYVVSLLNGYVYDNIIVDFYNPAYYQKLLKTLKRLGCPDDVTIRFLGNPLYDEVSLYDDLDGIVDNPIVILYNTCNDLNSYYQSEPYSEAVHYYSDIEASGKTDVDTYTKMLNMIDEIVKHMKEKNYSPLEMVAYLYDYFKSHYEYNQNFENEEHGENADLDKIFDKNNMICEGFSNLFSAILRRAGLLCFTYGTNNHQRNIIRLTDEKYGIDKIALIDPTWDLNDRNDFNNFLLKMDSYLYADQKEVITVPTSFFITQDDYNKNISNSNPVYATDPMGYGFRMLQLMGLSVDISDGLDEDEIANLYRDSLLNSSLIGDIPASKITDAVTHVRAIEGEYKASYEKRVDNSNVFAKLSSRGYFGHSPAIVDFYGNDIPVGKYFSHTNSNFVNITPQNKLLSYPRSRYDYESEIGYTSYLNDFYKDHFIENDNYIDVEEELTYVDEKDIDTSYETEESFGNVESVLSDEGQENDINESDNDKDSSIDADNAFNNLSDIYFSDDKDDTEDVEDHSYEDSDNSVINTDDIENVIDESLAEVSNDYESNNDDDASMESDDTFNEISFNDDKDDLDGEFKNIKFGEDIEEDSYKGSDSKSVINASDIESAIDESLKDIDNDYEPDNIEHSDNSSSISFDDNDILGSEDIEEVINGALDDANQDTNDDEVINSDEIESVINDSLLNVSDSEIEAVNEDVNKSVNTFSTYTPMTDEEIQRARENIEYDKYEEIYRNSATGNVKKDDSESYEETTDISSMEKGESETVSENSVNSNIVNIYVNHDGDIFYVSDEVASKYNLYSAAMPAKIEDKLVYRISKQEVERLVNNRNNENEPYEIELKLFERLYDRTDDDYLSFDKTGRSR